MIANELTLWHRHLPRMGADIVGVAGLFVSPGMGADGNGEIAALIVYRCVR